MNPDLFSTIGSGVLSGLVTTLLVFVVIRYWKGVLIPWYENRIYKDIKIAGEWETTGEEKDEVFHETAKIQQHAHRVWGDIIYKKDDELITYEFEGEFKNLIFTARYSVKGQNDLDRGTFTLMIRNNGNVLKGHYAWYLAELHDVISGQYEWIKKV